MSHARSINHWEFSSVIRRLIRIRIREGSEPTIPLSVFSQTWKKWCYNPTLQTNILWGTFLLLIPIEEAGRSLNFWLTLFAYKPLLFEGGNTNWQSSRESMARDYWQLYSIQFPLTWWVGDALKFFSIMRHALRFSWDSNATYLFQHREKWMIFGHPLLLFYKFSLHNNICFLT